IAPDFRMAVVATPSYFRSRPQPRTPHDLTEHTCINLRLPTHGGFYAWDFRRGGRELKVRVQGRVAFNAVTMIRNAALADLGLAYLPQDMVDAAIQKGRLVRVLADWCSPLPGYHLYYPSRRQPSPAFTLVVDALRYRSK
ncbi:MAG TPA: LysR substrate-binding domain-containing protein, partial [Blastocatellia bacterium]|nr:LysR substrate-binding domain-containing protein [Blastocatellia bacterium]